MKKLIITLCSTIAALSLTAAEADWQTDLPNAQAQAAKEKKLVLLDFTGSDWCPPCKALHKNVLTSPEFVEYAKTNLVLVEVDFPNQKKQSPELKKANNELAKKFGIESYPTIIVLSSDGKELSKKSGYGGEKPKSFIARIEGLKKK